MDEINLVLIIFIVFFLTSIIFSYTQEHFFAIPTSDERPFVNVYDEKRNQLPIVLLSHPFTRDNSYNQYKQYKKNKFLILGISSYNEFPKITSNKHDILNNPKEKAWTHYDYMTLVDGWLHCFREPNQYIIDTSLPKLLLSESDFCNEEVYKPDKKIAKLYDFIYICPKDDDKCDGWVATNKNWELAQKCISVMCNNYNLRGLLVGRQGCDLPKGCENKCKTTGFLSQIKLIEAFNQSKFILIPNKTDASPRILTEALCCNLPAIINYNILGGWKYIDPKKSGYLFKNIDDFEISLTKLLNNYHYLEPRNHYLEHFGRVNSGKKFKVFIENYFKDKVDLSNTKYLTL
jgi:hypothetical protein